MKCLSAIVVGGGNRGRLAYLSYALKNPTRLKIVAVAECDKKRRELFQKEASLPDYMVFRSSEEIFAREKLADIAIISTQDRDHYRDALLAIERGYDLILEKPISPIASECREILASAEKHNTKVYVAHVLRFAPFYQGVKALLEQEAIGKVLSIRMEENVGFWHFSHSYVRGNWRREELSSPSILAKCSHDLDLIVWLSGAKCKNLSSYGGLKYFKAENAPEGATARCLDCPKRSECPFDPVKIYIENDVTGCRTSGFGSLLFALTPEKSEEAVMRAIEKGPYGRCVFHSDNDVADYQSILGELENGVNFTFTLSAFSANVGRKMHIQGCKGEIIGDLEDKAVTLNLFGRAPQRISFDSEETFSGHGGGDGRLLTSVVKSLSGEGEDRSLTKLDVSMESHFMAFAAERSRKNGSDVIKIEEIRND